MAQRHVREGELFGTVCAMMLSWIFNLAKFTLTIIR
jgi:hypothetical protein